MTVNHSEQIAAIYEEHGNSDEYRKALAAALEDEGFDDAQERKRIALTLWMVNDGNDIGPDEIQPTTYNDNEFEYGRESNLVLTDDEADEMAQEYIADSLWAFNASFLASMTEIPQEVFEAMQPRCEDANDAIRKVVDKTCGLDNLVEQAISDDGRGHFLSQYDGEEREFDEYYIYRTN